LSRTERTPRHLAQGRLQQVYNKNFEVIWLSISKLSGVRSAVLLSPMIQGGTANSVVFALVLQHGQ